MAQSDRLPTMQYSSIPGDGWHFPAFATNGYTCGACGGWVASGAIHCCPHGGPTMQASGWQCYRCGQWVFGTSTSHACNPPVSAPPCHHCYCIDVPPSGERTKDHARCCKCSDVRVKL